MSSLEPILNNPDRSIYLLDEASVLKGNYIAQMNKSKHLFIMITRTVPLRGNYPLDGIYFLTRHNGWFKSSPAELPLTEGSIYETKIVIESQIGRSEHELLSIYYDGLVAAGGRDRIESKLRNTSEKITVFDFLSEEKYYEATLKYMTQDTPLEYKHGFPLSNQFLNRENYEKVFNSEVGKLLYDDIKVQRDNETKKLDVTANSLNLF